MACVIGDSVRFFAGVLGVGLAIFHDVRRVWKIVQGANLQVSRFKHVLQLADFAEVTGCQDELHLVSPTSCGFVSG